MEAITMLAKHLGSGAGEVSISWQEKTGFFFEPLASSKYIKHDWKLVNNPSLYT